MASYSDDFNRADGAPGGSWTNDATSQMVISSNHASNSGTGDVFARYNNTTGSAQYSKATYTQVANVYAAVGVRLQGGSGGNGFWLYINPSGAGWQIQRLPGGTVKTSGADTINNSDTVELRVDGSNNFTAYQNGTLLTGSGFNDGTYSGGVTGLGAFVSSGNFNLDNWFGGDYPPSTLAPPPRSGIPPSIFLM